jgi:signal transduction histidine kinase
VTAGEASSLPVPPAGDEISRLAATLNDMLARLQAAVAHERRFVADASHELRTPLTSLAGNVDFVARHGLNPEVLADLQLDTARLQRLVDDLLALEREAAGPPPREAVRLDRLVAAAVAERPAVRVGRCDPATVTGEAGALRRALDNLLENGEVHGRGEVTVTLEREDGVAVLAVSDEGPGLSAAAVEHAFERFWRAPEALGRPGSGLGLAIVRATTERHGGSVALDGATVRMTLPAAQPLAAGRSSAGA